MAPRWADLSIRKISTGVSSRIVVPLKAVAALSDNSAGLDSSVSAQPSQRIISGFKIESNYSLDFFFVNHAHSPEDTIFVNPPFLIDSSITSDRLRAAVFSNTFGFFHNSIDAKKYINPYFSFSLVCKCHLHKRIVREPRYLNLVLMIKSKHYVKSMKGLEHFQTLLGNQAQNMLPKLLLI